MGNILSPAPLPTTADGVLATETREAPPTHLLVKIESFSMLKKHGIDKYETSQFSAGHFKWKLIIYPNGHGLIEKDEEYVSVYLAMDHPLNRAVDVAFSICIFNQISANYVYTIGSTRRFNGLKKEWGFSKFISKKVLTDPSNGYLLDDNCIFGAEVFVKEYKTDTQCLSLKKIIVPDKHVFKISKFSELKKLWISDEFIAGDRKWRIRLYPNGIGNGIGRSVSIFLKYVDPICERVNANFTICLKNENADKHLTRKALGDGVDSLSLHI